MFHVRHTTEIEKPAALELARLAFDELRNVYSPTSEGTARAAAEASDFSRLVAVEEDGAVVGTLLYRYESDRIHIRALAVAPTYRRRGVARQLLDSVTEIAKRRASHALSLWAVAETGNVEVFKRLGFFPIKHEKSAILRLAEGGPATDVYMEKMLDLAK